MEQRTAAPPSVARWGRRDARPPAARAAAHLGGRERAIGRRRPECLDRLVGPLAGQRREALDEGPELVLAEQPDDGVAVVVAEPGGIEVERHRQVADDPHELPRLEDPVASFQERRPQPLRGDLVEVFEEPGEVAELADELRGGLLADAGNARDVVGRVALEGLEVDDLVGPQPVALVDPGRVVDDRVLDAGPRRHEPRPVGHELEHVEVAGHDGRIEAARLGFHGERADDVVGLVAAHLVDGDAEGLDDLADLGELVPQVVRHPLSVRLVLGEALVAERRPGQVEGDRDVVGPDVLEPAEDDRAEAEDGVDELAAARRQRREGEVSTVDEPVAVEQHQAFHRQPRGCRPPVDRGGAQCTRRAPGGPGRRGASAVVSPGLRGRRRHVRPTFGPIDRQPAAARERALASAKRASPTTRSTNETRARTGTGVDEVSPGDPTVAGRRVAPAFGGRSRPGRGMPAAPRTVRRSGRTRPCPTRRRPRLDRPWPRPAARAALPTRPRKRPHPLPHRPEAGRPDPRSGPRR